MNLGTVATPDPEPELELETDLEPEPEPAPDPDAGPEPEPGSAPLAEAEPPELPAEPEPPPVPKRPTVRRVGILEPRTERQFTSAPEPGPRTAVSPAAAGDGIFATFSGNDPRPVITGPLPAQTMQLEPVLEQRPAKQWEGLPGWDERSPRRVLIALAVALGVIAVVLLVQNLGGRSRPVAQTPAATATPAASVTDFGGPGLAGLATLSSPQAADTLRKAGQTGPGTVVEAWTWKDKNGTNLVASARITQAGQHQSLKVIHLARLETDEPSTLRVMTDPGLPACPAGGTASFTKDSLLVRDLNGDGVAEIAAGWESRCTGAKDSEVRLALITNGDKYIIRGKGVIGGKSGSAVPDPRTSSWPSGYAPALEKLFSRLYY